MCYLYFKGRFDVPDRHFTNKKLHTLVFVSSSIGTIKLLILVYLLFKNLKTTFFRYSSSF